MKVLKFGFFGEDIAQRIFIENYLKTFQISHQLDFQIDEEFCSQYQAFNKKEVESKFSETIQIGFSHFQQDVFFVGRDMDTADKQEFEKKYAQLQSKIWQQFQPRTCIFLPVQCIEHWLCYLKWQRENPNSTKNIDFEKKPNRDAKIQVYGKPKVTNKISIPIVEELTQNFSIDWLASRSISFLHFHNQVIIFSKNTLSQ